MRRRTRSSSSRRAGVQEAMLRTWAVVPDDTRTPARGATAHAGGVRILWLLQPRALIVTPYGRTPYGIPEVVTGRPTSTHARTSTRSTPRPRAGAGAQHTASLALRHQEVAMIDRHRADPHHPGGHPAGWSTTVPAGAPTPPLRGDNQRVDHGHCRHHCGLPPRQAARRCSAPADVIGCRGFGVE